MKRIGFKIKPRKPLKKSKLKKQSKAKIPVLKRKLWKAFSGYIRKRDKGICFTCGRKCDGKGYHAGHFIPKSVGGLMLYFDENNVHGQCYNCNINLGGNQYEYGKRLGEKLVAELYARKQAIVKWSAEDFIEKIKFYETHN